MVIYRSVKFGKGQMTIEEIGQKVRESRRRQGLTQPSLAMVAGTGLRFIVDLEAGKPTCQVGKVLQVLTALGIQLSVSDPATA